MNRLMTALMVPMLFGSWVVPLHADEMTYYVWTDEQGVTHASDTPPQDQAYETRAVGFDSGDGADATNRAGEETSASTEAETAASLGQDDENDENETGRRIVRGGDDSSVGRAVIMKRALPGEPGLGDIPNVPGAPDIGATGTAGP